MAITTANLNLRSAPGTDNPVQTVIPKGAVVTVTGAEWETRGTLWYPAGYEGLSGWVSGKHLMFVSGSRSRVTYVESSVTLARSMLGLWYHFGENFDQLLLVDKRGDCSGFVGWVSEASGYRPGSLPLYEYSSDEMFDCFASGEWAAERIKTAEVEPMDLVFYGYGSHASHVVFSLTKGTVIGASGGFRATRTDADAERVNAMVRIDRLRFHPHRVIGIFRPSYEDVLA